MTVTIGLVANVFNEVNALPGWLETHLPFFDDVRVLHSGPQGERSTDGTIELLEKWCISVEFCAIDEGFGVVRTKALRMSPCDYVMILDADERFYPLQTKRWCNGEEMLQGEVDRILGTYHFRDGNVPVWDEIAKLGSGLQVHIGDAYNQGKYLRDILEDKKPDVVYTIRRHWHDLGMCRPTQNWYIEPDWQARLVRNTPTIGFDPSTRMHERLVGASSSVRADLEYGPFWEHFHFTFKKLEPWQRAHDIRIYDSIHGGKTPPMSVSAHLNP